jgi:Plant transposon protein
MPNPRDDPCIMLVFALTAVAGLILFCLDEFVEGEEVSSVDNARALMQTVLAETFNLYRLYKRGRVDESGAPVPKRRRIASNFNWDRARQCVHEDFMSPIPRFNDRQFERTFRVTRTIVEELSLVLGNADPFFRETYDVAKRTPGICPYAKILFALQMLAFGVSPSALLHYYQMGETTARLGFKKLCKIMAHSPALRARYFRKMTRSDAMKVSDLHHRVHGVQGMVGSLDCMHVVWKNCPIVWQGSYSGKEKVPTLVLEAMADHNLFFWHAAFGWPGTQNDISIWDASALHQDFMSGAWGEFVDFEFNIGEFRSSKLYILVDGIYPPLSRFVKSHLQPIGRQQRAYNAWQEASLY